MGSCGVGFVPGVPLPGAERSVVHERSDRVTDSSYDVIVVGAGYIGGNARRPALRASGPTGAAAGGRPRLRAAGGLPGGRLAGHVERGMGARPSQQLELHGARSCPTATRSTWRAAGSSGARAPSTARSSTAAGRLTSTPGPPRATTCGPTSRCCRSTSRCESDLDFDGAYHGQDGPMPVSRPLTEASRARLGGVRPGVPRRRLPRGARQEPARAPAASARFPATSATAGA